MTYEREVVRCPTASHELRKVSNCHCANSWEDLSLIDFKVVQSQSTSNSATQQLLQNRSLLICDEVFAETL